MEYKDGYFLQEEKKKTAKALGDFEGPLHMIHDNARDRCYKNVLNTIDRYFRESFETTPRQLNS